VKQRVIILKNGKVDPLQAGAAIAANIDRSRREKAKKKLQASKSTQMEFIGNGFNTDPKISTPINGFNNDQEYSLTDARRDHEILKTKISETKLKELRHQLVPRDEINKEIISLGSAVKLALRNVPRRLADSLAIMSDPKEIQIILQKEFDGIINTLRQSRYGKPKRSRTKNPGRRMGDHLAAPG